MNVEGEAHYNKFYKSVCIVAENTMWEVTPYLILEVEEVTPDIVNDFHGFYVKMYNNVRCTKSTESALEVINSTWARRSSCTSM